MTITIFYIIKLLIIADALTFVLATNDNRENSENDGCTTGLSGPDCDIPYEACNDGHRKCFNGSKCVQNNEKDSFTGKYEYHCDCSYAAEISSYAGHECEHSATVICGEKFIGNHFCSNGGECGTYFSNGNERTGCHCPEDFEGAHCQYIIGTMDGDLLGETLISQYGGNFYGFAPESTPKRRASDFASIIITCVILAFIFMVGMFSFNKNRRGSNTSNDNQGDKLLDQNDGQIT